MKKIKLRYVIGVYLIGIVAWSWVSTILLFSFNIKNSFLEWLAMTPLFLTDKIPDLYTYFFGVSENNYIIVFNLIVIYLLGYIIGIFIEKTISYFHKKNDIFRFTK